MDERYRRAIERIDAANASDPNVLDVRGVSRPKALGEAELATEWVRRLAPDASEALLLATRAHHLRRWEVPRSSYPDERAGYLKWKRDLHERHGTQLGELLSACGYPEGHATVARAVDIVRKRGLAQGDAEVQVLEDALCLVFLETQFDELASRLDEATMVEVIRKSVRKMSAAGRAAALELPYSTDGRRLLEAAIGG